MRKLKLYKRIFTLFRTAFVEENWIIPCAVVCRALWYCTFNYIPAPYTLCATPDCTLILRYVDTKGKKTIVEFMEFRTLKTIVVDGIVQR